MFTLSELQAAADVVGRHMPSTPQHNWPLLSRRAGCEVFVKHENHSPIGAFKVRGGITYMDELRRSGAHIEGVITATRGNHGQSVARAATAVGLRSVILVPHGNSREKNAAMRAFGAELIEHGVDFDEAKDEAFRLAGVRNLHIVPPFDAMLVKGVATAGREMLTALPDLDTVYVPIGMGSGACGMIMARDLLGAETEVVGVVAANAPCIALSVAAGKPISTNSAATFADGMACRVPDPLALDVISRGAARIVTVSEDEIADAMRAYYEDTHNLAEGAGAAAFAALMQERHKLAGKRVGVVLSGSNVDREVFAEVLAGQTPKV
ncbi:MAG: threonine dehydratase [Hyphomicrobium sp.]|nr:threonine dehydratase [Hyphomicrobium sp.]